MPVLARVGPLAIALVTACTTEVFTPPARPMPLTGAVAPGLGKHDVQLDASSAGVVMGPGITAGNLRYRHGVAGSTALTVDAGLVHVRDGGGGSFDPQAGMARVGVHTSAPAADGIDMGGFAGAGGGHAWGIGSWVSGDAGFAFTGTNKWFRPTLVADIYLSQPFATHVFYADDTMLRLPTTWGWQLLLGAEVGVSHKAVIAGVMIAQLFANANDTQGDINDVFIGASAGVRMGDR